MLTEGKHRSNVKQPNGSKRPIAPPPAARRNPNPLLSALERIAVALEQNTAAQLMLLGELTMEPEQGDKPDDDSTYLDGTPKQH